MFEPDAQGSSLFRDRGCTLLRPPTGEGRSDALPVDARTCIWDGWGMRSRLSETEAYHAGAGPGAEHWRVQEDRDFYLEGLRLAIGKLARMDFAHGVVMSGHLGHSRRTLSTRWKKWSEI